LAEFYNEVVEADGSSLEIVFVSSDRDDKSFNEYYGEMPWISLPFSDRVQAQALGQRFGVRGIPAMIVLDAETGEILDADGRGTVQAAKGNIKKALSRWGI
jgi:nucleoredoxin